MKFEDTLEEQDSFMNALILFRVPSAFKISKAPFSPDKIVTILAETLEMAAVTGAAGLLAYCLIRELMRSASFKVSKFERACY